MNKIAALGAVKADKHRGLVPSLPDGEEHGLSHVQVKTLCNDKSLMLCGGECQVFQGFLGSAGGQDEPLNICSNPSPTALLPSNKILRFLKSLLHISQSCVGWLRWIKLYGTSVIQQGCAKNGIVNQENMLVNCSGYLDGALALEELLADSPTHCSLV